MEEKQKEKPLNWLEKISARRIVKKGKSQIRKLRKQESYTEKERHNVIKSIEILLQGAVLMSEEGEEMSIDEIRELPTDSLLDIWETLLDDLKRKI